VAVIRLRCLRRWQWEQKSLVVRCWFLVFGEERQRPGENEQVSGLCSGERCCHDPSTPRPLIPRGEPALAESSVGKSRARSGRDDNQEGRGGEMFARRSLVAGVAVEVLSGGSRNLRSATSGVGSPVDSTGVQKSDLVG